MVQASRGVAHPTRLPSCPARSAHPVCRRSEPCGAFRPGRLPSPPVTARGLPIYARHYGSDHARVDTYQGRFHSYNHHRPHTDIGGKSPIDRVHNVSGNNT